jgi:endonuclease/exonuclease/phosphatase family metal-dependent hydrolase
VQVKVLHYIYLSISIGLALALFGGLVSPYFSPAKFWPIAFFGLAFPFMFLANVLFLIFLVFIKKKMYIIQTVVLVLALLKTPAFIQFNAKTLPEPKPKRTLNVINFNTHYMGAYDYAGGDSGYFFNMLDTIKPDIICLQEFANLGGNYEMPMFKRFFKQFKHFYNVNADALSTTFPTGYGVCIFSRYPIVNKGFLELENQNNNLTVFADVLVDTDTIRVVNTHLKSIVFDKHDYRTMENLKEIEHTNIGAVHRIFAKLKYAFQSRAKQVDKIRERLQSTKHKVILCGDFNDSPTSYSYLTIRGNMKDAFRESGKGMSRTYIGKMPSFRIDYILHDNAWNSYNYQTNTLNFSDHKMVSCTIALPN